jgi:7-carboxy-7-deazaguanine synthase
MEISELFCSIQGEGKRSGYPSFFIRTNHCNLRCQFISGNLCDTDYTSWYSDHEKNLGEISIPEIIKYYKKCDYNDIVITGGEPTTQLEELKKLCFEVKKLNDNAFITVETNGTFVGDFVKHIDLVSISPKLSSSVPIKTEFEKMHDQNRINIEVFKKYHEFFGQLLFDIQWKFVLTSKKDMNEIIELQKQVGFENKDIFLMPEGRTKKDLERNRSDTVKICKDYSINYSDRLQILIWDTKRGV